MRNKDSFIDIEGRKKTLLSSFYNFLCIISLGFLYMICKYNPKIKIFLTTKKSNLNEAEIIIITNKFKNLEIQKIIKYKTELNNKNRFVKDNIVRILDTKYSRFIYDYISDKFVVCLSNKQTDNFENIYSKKLKLSINEEFLDLQEKEIFYGKNISNLQLPSYFQILLTNTYSISNLIDILCIILWFNIEYKTYGSVIGLFRTYSYFLENYLDFKHKQEMEKSQKFSKIKVFRNGKFQEINSLNLFPGDLVIIRPSEELCADIKILKGDCITDESFLTGESVPICKSASQGSILYSGTSVLRSVGDFKGLENTKINSLYRVKNLTNNQNKKINDLNKKINDLNKENDLNKDNHNKKINDKYYKENLNKRKINSMNKTKDEFINKTKNNKDEENRFKDEEDCMNKTKDECINKINNKDEFINKINIKDEENRFKDEEDYAVGVVVGTGFNTARGRIMKDIINPKPVYIPFLSEAMSYIFYTIILAISFTIFYCFYFHFILNWSPFSNFIYSLDLLFTLASPALYASLKVGTQVANRKLSNYKIKCNNTDRIFLSGNINMAIFDKTGTLTSEGLEFLYFDDLNMKTSSIRNISRMSRMGFSSCHSVYELDGKYCGDNLDIQMFILSESRLVMKNEKECMREIIMGRYENITGPFLKEKDKNHDKLFYTIKEDMKFNREEINLHGENELNLHGDDKLNIYRDACKDVCKDACKDECRDGFNKDEFNDELNIFRDAFKFEDSNCVQILRTFDFSSEAKRMSVIVKNNTKKYIFTKGSPDKIKNLLKIIPENYDLKVKEHSLVGHRVISLAYKEIKEIGTQEECEKDLLFLGLVVFSNKLKPESKSVITELNQANINPLICTGDNILTAISVGRESGIIDNPTVIFPVLPEKCTSIYDVDWVCLSDEDLVFDKVRLLLYKNNYDTYCDDFVVACEGKEYEYFKNTNYFNFILEKGKIFARFNPAQKKSLVEDLRNKNKILFCGDGANDSGAIATADVGIALAHNEASLASSFCASNIKSVPLLIKECRNAYVSSISLFKYVSMTYLLAFFCLGFLVLRNLFLSDFQTLHIDIFIIVPMMLIIPNFNMNDKLYKSPPNISLFDYKEYIPFCVSLISQSLIIFYLSMYGPGSDEITEKSKAGTIVFFISACQSVFNGLYFSDAVPHRESIYQNRRIIKISGLFLIFNILLLILNWVDNEFINWVLSKYLFERIDNKEMGIIGLGILMSGIACFLVPKYTRKIIKNF
ncbi:cation-transporting ATPase [Vairimorpha necatrix]|uniref:Cation-transporting ATPase n=1 Tax=Vairimorpha necatrix TaxID=6039 RepID=A0AAX4JBA1_9MICR